MGATTFLAELWGPVCLAVGLGIFLSREYYVKIYQALDKETLAGLMFGMIGIAAAVAQIHFHNTWESFPQAVISLLGWGLLIKSAMFAISPKFVERSANWFSKGGSAVDLSGALCFILGLYLCWYAFLS